MAEASVAYLLDTSAILAYLLNEPAGHRVKAFFPRAALASVSIAELYAVLWLRYGPAKANETVAMIKQWQRPWLWPTEEILLLAGRLRAVYHLGLGDGFVAAFALATHTILVTLDNDFRVLQHDLRLHYLH